MTLYDELYFDINIEGAKSDIKRLVLALEDGALDDYFELLSSERKGEKMYVISLRANGYAFERGYMQMRREGYRKICWTVASAVLAFLVGVILKRIF